MKLFEEELFLVLVLLNGLIVPLLHVVLVNEGKERLISKPEYLEKSERIPVVFLRKQVLAAVELLEYLWAYLLEAELMYFSDCVFWDLIMILNKH